VSNPVEPSEIKSNQERHKVAPYKLRPSWVAKLLRRLPDPPAAPNLPTLACARPKSKIPGRSRRLGSARAPVRARQAVLRVRLTRERTAIAAKWVHAADRPRGRHGRAGEQVRQRGLEAETHGFFNSSWGREMRDYLRALRRERKGRGEEGRGGKMRMREGAK
jgi:hypothetical protein